MIITSCASAFKIDEFLCADSLLYSEKLLLAMQALLHVALDLHEPHHVLPTYKLVLASMGQSMTLCHENMQSKRGEKYQNPPSTP